MRNCGTCQDDIDNSTVRYTRKQYWVYDGKRDKKKNQVSAVAYAGFFFKGGGELTMMPGQAWKSWWAGRGWGGELRHIFSALKYLGEISRYGVREYIVHHQALWQASKTKNKKRIQGGGGGGGGGREGLNPSTPPPPPPHAYAPGYRPPAYVFTLGVSR